MTDEEKKRIEQLMSDIQEDAGDDLVIHWINIAPFGAYSQSFKSQLLIFGAVCTLQSTNNLKHWLNDMYNLAFVSCIVNNIMC